MINTRRRWLYSKTEEPRIYEVDEDLKGDLYDSPAFDDPRTKCVTGIPKAEPEPEIEKGLKKYPSQMNKDELIEHGAFIGLEFKDGMSKREMRKAITEAVKDADDGKD